MKQNFIPLGKQSKQKQREFHAARRGDWGGINPVTRKPPNPKAYNRKKSGQWFNNDHHPDFLHISINPVMPGNFIYWLTAVIALP